MGQRAIDTLFGKPTDHNPFQREALQCFQPAPGTFFEKLTKAPYARIAKASTQQIIFHVDMTSRFIGGLDPYGVYNTDAATIEVYHPHTANQRVIVKIGDDGLLNDPPQLPRLQVDWNKSTIVATTPNSPTPPVELQYGKPVTNVDTNRSRADDDLTVYAVQPFNGRINLYVSDNRGHCGMLTIPANMPTLKTKLPPRY